MSLSDHGEDKIKILLDDRNLKWMCKIEQLIHTQPAFIAVGAAHLDGENRLINLLRERGYTVSPFMADR